MRTISCRGGELDIARHVLVCWYYGMYFAASRQTTLCTFHRHDFGSFKQFLWSSDFFCWQYTGCPKKCVPLPILSICFVTKTKITIWAESIVESALSFFSFQKFYWTGIIFYRHILMRIISILILLLLLLRKIQATK